MYWSFFKQKWLSFCRSPALGWELRTKALAALAVLWLLVSLAYLGVSFNGIVEETGLAADPLAFLNRYLLSVLLVLLIGRFFFEQGSHVQIRPYLHLPISRHRLASLFSISVLASMHNLYPLAFLIPFSLSNVLPRYGSIGLACYLGGVGLLLTTVTYVVFFFRKALSDKPFTSTAGIISIIFLAGASDFAGLISLPGASAFLFNELAEGNLLVLASLAAVGFAVGGAFYRMALCNVSLADNTVLNDHSQHRLSRRVELEYGGQVLNLILLDLRLLLRNRLSRTHLGASLLICAMYIFLAFESPVLLEGVWPFVGVFASGAFIVQPGQLLFSMNGTYYDTLLSADIETRTYAFSKLVLLQGSCLLVFLLFLPLFLVWRPDLVFFHFAFLIYNVGVSTVVTMLAAAIASKEKLNLGRGIFLNYETLSVFRLLCLAPLFILPYALRVLIGDFTVILILLVLIGLAGLLFTPLWSEIVANILKRRKYTMAEAFRKG